MRKPCVAAGGWPEPWFLHVTSYSQTAVNYSSNQINAAQIRGPFSNRGWREVAHLRQAGRQPSLTASESPGGPAAAQPRGDVDCRMRSRSQAAHWRRPALQHARRGSSQRRAQQGTERQARPASQRRGETGSPAGGQRAPTTLSPVAWLCFTCAPSQKGKVLLRQQRQYTACGQARGGGPRGERPLALPMA